ncbi:MAG: type I-E CRISPR-associated protein Cas7/Cse4/CasC [Pseudomonadota bacterium]|nr:type I-E CRISPR-associated protein Cas7/Cse4/CasC [Pseudomonadota bacterium]
MSLPRFIQIHTLHAYPAALLNRDDAGLAKRLPLGNAVRTRISSQCLKRHWRVTEDQFSLEKLDVPMASRSRIFFEEIRKKLVETNVPIDIADVCANTLRDAFRKNLDKLIKEAKKAKDEKKKKGETQELDEDEAGTENSGEQKQAILLGLPEYEYLKQICIRVAKTAISGAEVRLTLLEQLKAERSNFDQMPLNCGLESALFGRMVTSDVFASREASISVAHAFTVHQAQVENDYFTVVDDLKHEGSAGIFDTELASGLYYGYVVVDVPQLVENLEGIAATDCFAGGTLSERRELAGRVVQHLLHLIATVSPGAKRGSTAPFDWAKFMLVEAGDWQPRSLAGAFHDALPLEEKNSKNSMRQRAVARISQELSAMDEAYGAPLSRRFLSLDAVEVPGAERINLAKLGEWASEIVRQGVC